MGSDFQFASEAVTVSGKLSDFNHSSDKGSKVIKAFCVTCGSPIYGKTPDFRII
jgi:hypothetical protein